MTTTNHRRFSRIPFEARATLYADTTTWPAELIDISLKGALVTLPRSSAIRVGDRLRLDLSVNDGALIVRMETVVAHVEGDRLGLDCRHIDLDSITQLRRLVELNLGDPAQLDRELHALGTPSDAR